MSKILKAAGTLVVIMAVGANTAFAQAPAVPSGTDLKGQQQTNGRHKMNKFGQFLNKGLRYGSEKRGPKKPFTQRHAAIVKYADAFKAKDYNMLLELAKADNNTRLAERMTEEKFNILVKIYDAIQAQDKAALNAAKEELRVYREAHAPQK